MLPMELTHSQITAFQETVWGHYGHSSRDMPWRTEPSAYYVLVSEMMLQQTQVVRVVPKFEAFIARFPDINFLAGASLAEVLTMWNGLGYNRRAKYLWQAAGEVAGRYDGTLPDTLEALVALPGIGPNTAGAIMAYAFNQPVVFVETNIRTVYLHHFYAEHMDTVADKELRQLVEQTLDRERIREWYWALMDYGTHLKKVAGGRLNQSRHYRKQAPLRGSLREMRGRIIRALTAGPYTDDELRLSVQADERYEPALAALIKEGLIRRTGSIYSLTAVTDA